MITIVTPYYNNERQLESWKQAYVQYPEEVKWIVVDDGSQLAPIVPRDVQLYRIHFDKPWNQHGARNLGAYMADYGWLLMCDMDTIPSPRMMRDMVEHEYKLDPQKWYTFERENVATGEKKGVHLNTHLVHKYLYWSVGGMDEDYCGSYGGDGQFVAALQESRRVHREEWLVHYFPRSVYKDAGTNTFSRKGTVYHEEYRRRLKEKNKNGHTTPITPLRFAWSRLQ